MHSLREVARVGRALPDQHVPGGGASQPSASTGAAGGIQERVLRASLSLLNRLRQREGKGKQRILSPARSLVERIPGCSRGALLKELRGQLLLLMLHGSV